MPPPLPAVLPDATHALSVNVPEFQMPPPISKPVPLGFPLDTVKPDIVTVTPALIVKMRKSGVPPAVLRFTDSMFAPGPLIVRFLSISSSPLVSVIVAGPTEVRPAAKVIVSPGQAVLIASRKLPAPVSLVLVTTVGPQLTVIVAVAAELT